MRRRGLITVAAAVVAFLGFQGAACGDSDGPTDEAPTSAASLRSRTVESGAVTVKITPLRIDAKGATFKLTFDTHSVELSSDVERTAHLTVGDVTWPTTSWSGDGPGGHHREGTVSFSAAGRAVGPVELQLEELPTAVSVSWTLPGR